MTIKKIFLQLTSLIIDTIRPLLGPRGVCIYHPQTCTLYTKRTLKEKPLYKAIPLIIIRLVSCNPIMALYLKKKNDTK